MPTASIWGTVLKADVFLFYNMAVTVPTMFLSEMLTDEEPYAPTGRHDVLCVQLLASEWTKFKCELCHLSAV